MLTLKPDVRITRRLQSHFIIDEEGFVLLQTPRLQECFAWLTLNDHAEVLIAFDGEHFRLAFSKDTSHRPPASLTNVPAA